MPSNYTPLIGTQDFGPISSTSSLIGRGDGPAGVSTPLIYVGWIDDTTGEFYVNEDGTSSGWTLVGGSVSGVTGVYAYDGDPNTHVSAVGPALCLGKGSTDGALWKKMTAGTSSNEWIQVAAAT